MTEFVLVVPDNNSHMCSTTDAVFEELDCLAVCDFCNYRTDFEYINPAFKLGRRVYDLSSTYDGYYIASLKFKELIEREGIEGAEFVALVNEPEYFVLSVKLIAKFDVGRRECKAENYCSHCDSYESFIGATPAYLKEALPNDICRSDVVFGSGNEKSPLLFISSGFADLLKREKLTGIRLEKVAV